VRRKRVAVHRINLPHRLLNFFKASGIPAAEKEGVTATVMLITHHEFQREAPKLFEIALEGEANGINRVIGVDDGAKIVLPDHVLDLACHLRVVMLLEAVHKPAEEIDEQLAALIVYEELELIERALPEAERINETECWAIGMPAQLGDDVIYLLREDTFVDRDRDIGVLLEVDPVDVRRARSRRCGETRRFPSG
jgi:hypothetical protein